MRRSPTAAWQPIMLAVAISALGGCASPAPQVSEATQSSGSSLPRYDVGDDDFGEYLMTYYLAPDPAEAIDRLVNLGIDPERLTLERTSLTSVFYAHLLRSNSDLARSTMNRILSVQSNAWDRGSAFVLGIAFFKAGLFSEGDVTVDLKVSGGTPEARDIIYAPFEFEEFSPETPHDLDLCWISFFATGQYEYVWKVADYLKFQDTATRRASGDGETQLMNALMAAAAKWALSANARKHKAVRDALMEYAALHADAAGAEARGIAVEAAGQL